ncbi:hypothetical protein N9H39_02515 [Gammaproteobacteria bacterium]|nr:hypothetical protein [Gammaproteobacteria bacterium]
MWWGLRTLLDVDSPYPVSLPNDPLLFQELTSPTYRVTPGGLLQIESKDDIRRRLSRSIDRADSVIYCSIRNPVLPTARTVYSTLGAQREPKSVPVVNWAG